MRTRHLLSVASLALLLPLAGRAQAPPQTPAAHDDGTAAMAHAHAHDTPAASAEIRRAMGPHAVEGETVTYAHVGGKNVAGFLARPKGKANAPGLIVIHEWWGLNDNIREEAKQLASHGYAALAVDLYGGQAATDPDKAQALMKQVMSEPGAAQQ